ILHPDFNTYFGFAQKMSQPSNAYHRTFFEKGDLEHGFAEADLIIENTYVTQRIHQGYIEPQAVLVNIDESSRVHVWVCSKVHQMQEKQECCREFQGACYGARSP